jgi:transcriptional regulator with XRE-family HTH domain
MRSLDENRGECETFGTFLRGQRARQGLSLRKFAELVGIAPSYASNIESGQMPPPSEQIMSRMAAVLSLRPNLLLVRAGKLSSSTLRWFWSQPAAVELLGCASGLNESLARMFVQRSSLNLSLFVEG